MIPGALVTATNRDTGISTTVHADANGHFDVLSLPPGHYGVLFATPGFGAVQMKDVVVKLGSTSTLEPHLKVGPSQNVSVVPGEGYNHFTGPGTTDLDVSISRDIHFSDWYTLWLRAESFDIFNHSNYLETVNTVQFSTAQQNDASGNPTNVWIASPNPSFGTPLASFPQDGSRTFQLSTKFSF